MPTYVCRDRNEAYVNELSEELEALKGRVDHLRQWARSRIDHCRREEARFTRDARGIEASAERQALQAVLAIIDGKTP